MVDGDVDVVDEVFVVFCCVIVVVGYYVCFGGVGILVIDGGIVVIEFDGVFGD